MIGRRCWRVAVLLATMTVDVPAWQSFMPSLAGEWRSAGGTLSLGADASARRVSVDGRLDVGTYTVNPRELRLNWRYKIFESGDPMRSCSYTLQDDALTLTCQGPEDCVFNLKAGPMPRCTPGPKQIYKYRKESHYSLLVRSWSGKVKWTGSLEFRRNGTASRSGPSRSGFADFEEAGTYRVKQEAERSGTTVGTVTITWDRRYFRADPQHECRYEITFPKGPSGRAVLMLMCENDTTYVYNSR
jgi:hypothetical protein